MATLGETPKGKIKSFQHVNTFYLLCHPMGNLQQVHPVKRKEFDKNLFRCFLSLHLSIFYLFITRNETFR